MAWMVVTTVLPEGRNILGSVATTSQGMPSQVNELGPKPTTKNKKKM